MSAARAAKLSGALLDRLQLDEKRVEGIARSIEDVVALPDPIGTVVGGSGSVPMDCGFSVYACRWV